MILREMLLALRPINYFRRVPRTVQPLSSHDSNNDNNSDYDGSSAKKGGGSDGCAQLWGYGLDTAILRTCQDLYREGCEILYQENTLEVHILFNSWQTPLTSNMDRALKYRGCPTLRIPAVSANNLLREHSGTLLWNHQELGLNLLRCFRKFEVRYYMDRRRPEDSQPGAIELFELLPSVLSDKVVHVKIKPFFGAAPTDDHILNQVDPFRHLRCEKFTLEFVNANDRKQPTSAAIALAVDEITREVLSNAPRVISDNDMTGRGITLAVRSKAPLAVSDTDSLMTG